jgi:iron complex transport system ATP-binding protein
MSELSIISLSKFFGAQEILAGINLDIEKGEIIGLIGPNGSGKTTLLRCIAGLLETDGGDILFQGHSRAQIDAKKIARAIAYLPQSGEVHWDVTVELLVTFGRLPHHGFWNSVSDTDRRAVTEALEACDVAQFRARSVRELSGGERSRVLLARAMAGMPEVLLADEPISGLDPGHAIDIMSQLSELARNGMTVVVVMHDLTLAARYCNRLVLLHDKRIAASGPPNSVLTDENLARCYGIRAFRSKSEAGDIIVPIVRVE